MKILKVIILALFFMIALSASCFSGSVDKDAKTLTIEVVNTTSERILIYIDSLDHNNDWNYPSQIFGGEVNANEKATLMPRKHNQIPYRYTYKVMVRRDNVWVKKEYRLFRIPLEVNFYSILIKE